MSKNNENLIWIDLEMTGLDSNSDQIIEIASVVTDKQLSVLAEGPVLAVYQPDSVLESMDEWNTRQHGLSGLSARVKASKTSVADAEKQTLNFISQYVEKGFSPICGNSICQDRRFLARLMPELEAYFNYRNLDVSSLKELVRRWAPDIAAGFSKESRHLALDDIHDSIAELRYYREKIMKI
ncbi:MAG: oligoribonuclease [Gammaproteobacteria bacterium]|nr:oligoribonuclease [Gammaproteobacteria bacterium]